MCRDVYKKVLSEPTAPCFGYRYFYSMLPDGRFNVTGRNEIKFIFILCSIDYIND